MCEYDTDDPQEPRAQATKRRAADLRAARSTVHDSLSWLRHQSPDTIVSCIRQLQQAEDPYAEICTVVAQQRSQRRSPEIPILETMVGSSSAATSPLVAELLFRFPNTFPRLPETIELSAKTNEGLDEKAGAVVAE